MQTYSTRDLNNLVLLHTLHFTLQEVLQYDPGNPLATYLNGTLADREQEYKDLVASLPERSTEELEQMLHSVPPSMFRFEIIEILHPRKEPTHG